MSVSEFQRHQVFQWLEEAMGSEKAAIMMHLLPPVGWGDVATRADLDSLQHRLESSLTKSFVAWLLVSQATVVTLVGIMIGVLVAFS